MDRARLLLVTLGLFTTFALVEFAPADELGHEQPITIDTDLGLDDAATLAMALQNPEVHVEAVVACGGACDGSKGAEFLRRMLREFNRVDVVLYGPANADRPMKPPAFRGLVEEALGAALPQADNDHRPHAFAPDAYAAHEGKTTILALGPLTNLAAALQAKPEIKTGIERVVVAGWADVGRDWNLQYDREAYETVRGSGIPMVFVAPEENAARKPDTWQEGELNLGSNTAVGEQFLRRLLAPHHVREHYVAQLSSFYDELTFLYVVEPSIFKPGNRQDVVVPADAEVVVACFTRLLSEGRQGERHVVFTDEPLPASVLRPDVRQRRDHIIARHGRREWFAQLLMNELHQHLGAYSVIGVKMGLRAAEVLNAPQHGMTVVSHVDPTPPVSCLNDGIIVATGCTPGRALFSQGKADAGKVAAAFTYNGRTATLVLKDTYRDQVRRRIQALRRTSSLEDHAYWQGVRELGLDIWENWHRGDLFTVTVTTAGTDLNRRHENTRTGIDRFEPPQPQRPPRAGRAEHSHGSSAP
ncbi:MAG TPA: nucleoside hydrolase [Phycisphaerae bacterium]|nr:nucleoside hydrolase [Phycisphaerae bacterium]